MSRVVSTWPHGTLLPAVRSTLAGGDEALLCVAFANRKGVALIDGELAGLADRGGVRVLLTTVFGGGPSGVTRPAVSRLHRAGVAVRVLNPGHGTYRPKMYLARGTRGHAGVIGSANLTAGLLGNIETAIALDPLADASSAAEAWELAEAFWNHPGAHDWDAELDEVDPEPMPPSLVEQLVAALPVGTSVATIASGARNRIAEISSEGIWVETQRSSAAGHGPQLVEAWMLDLAWTALTTDGQLTNVHLLNDLHVHRSSFVCAALAMLPEVEVLDRRPITLRWKGQPVSTARAATTRTQGPAPSMRGWGRRVGRVWRTDRVAQVACDRGRQLAQLVSVDVLPPGPGSTHLGAGLRVGAGGSASGALYRRPGACDQVTHGVPGVRRYLRALQLDPARHIAASRRGGGVPSPAVP